MTATPTAPAATSAPPPAASGHRPRVAFVGKTWVSDPPGPELARKLAVLARHVDPLVVAVGPRRPRGRGDPRVRLVPGGQRRAIGRVVFSLLAPVEALRWAAGHSRGAVVGQSPYEALGLLLGARLLPTRLRPRVVIEVHGDWPTATRLYGGPVRRALAPLAERAATWALRRADRVRAVGSYTAELARRAGFAGEVDRYPAFSDYEAFLALPAAPAAAKPVVACVAALERAKGVDVLLEAWARVVSVRPDARLVVAGDGARRGDLRRQAHRLGIEGRVDLRGHVPPAEVRHLLDGARGLVVPSRSEGLGRVVLEAFARGRPVVASQVGGLPELVEDGVTGLLVPPGDDRLLATALLRLLGRPDEATRMGTAARKWIEHHDPAVDFERGIARLAAWAAAS